MKAIEKLRDKKRLTKPGDLKARKFAIEQLQARGFSVGEIAEQMNISRYTVYNVLKKNNPYSTNNTL